MDYKLLQFTDNAQGQLDSGISASGITIVLKAGEGAEFPQAYSGNATSAGDVNTLNSTGIGAKATLGDFIYNLTDGSHAWITTVNTNDVETTDLIGGTGNTWDNSDEWVINPFVITINKRDGDGQITDYEKVLIKNRATDTLTVETRGFDGSSAQSFATDDYVDLFVVRKGFEGLNKMASEVSQLIQTLSDNKADLSVVTSLLDARNWKQSVRVATTGAGTLTTSFENGDTIDGITLATGDRILIKDQATATENGIYTVNASGSPTRASDFNESDEISGAVVVAQEGTSNGDTAWLCTNDGSVTIGSDNIAFILLPGSPAIASQAEAEAGTDNTKMMTSLRVKQSIISEFEIVAGTDALSAEANTERSTSSTSYIKVKEIEINETGAYTVTFEGKGSSTINVYARIYKNGAAFGTERITNSSTYVSYSEDLSFADGDLCQIYIRALSTTSFVQNLKIEYSLKKTSASGTVITD